MLALDTSGNTGSVALASLGKIICEFKVNNTMTHSQTLMPLVEQAFLVSGIKKSEVNMIACSVGPGSFTGLRIGAAVAKGLALGLGCKIVPVSSLEILTYNIYYKNTVVPIMDARRNQVYAAIYENGKCRHQPMVCDISHLLALLPSSAIFLGDGVYAYQEELVSAGHFIAPPHLLLQSAASLAMLAFTKIDDAVDVKHFDLTYIRQSQAERELQCK